MATKCAKIFIREGNEMQRKIIYQYIVDNFFALIENEFGNYLIQFIQLILVFMEKLKEGKVLL